MKIALILALTMTSSFALADNYTRGYVKQDGKYVEGHYKSAPDRNPNNNYSTQGNTNPYTGQQGTRNAEQVQQGYSNSYGGGSNNNHNQAQQQRYRW